MSRSSELRQPPEQGYLRNALFALELVDPVTLSRVSDGVVITTDGLRRKPVMSAGGLFVWLEEDITHLRKVSVDPQALPFEPIELAPADLHLPPDPHPLTTIELSPRLDYPFSTGTTGMRGVLIEERVLPPEPRVPVARAVVHLRWLDEDGVTWRDAPTKSHTSATGDFVSVLRLASAEVPRLDATGAMSARLHVSRGAGNDRISADVKLPQGRVADPSTLSALIFAWDELPP